MRVHSIFLHLMRSLSECPLWSTLRVRPSHRVLYPWGVRQIGGICTSVCNACVGVQGRNASCCRGPGWSDRMLMAFSDVRLRAQHGFKLVWSTRNASLLHRLRLVLRDQSADNMLDAGKLADNACSAISYQASLHRLHGSCGTQ